MVAIAAVDPSRAPNSKVCPLRVQGARALLCSSEDLESGELSPLAEGCARILGYQGSRG
jgi:hypothetical protein